MTMMFFHAKDAPDLHLFVPFEFDVLHAHPHGLVVQGDVKYAPLRRNRPAVCPVTLEHDVVARDPDLGQLAVVVEEEVGPALVPEEEG